MGTAQPTNKVLWLTIYTTVDCKPCTRTVENVNKIVYDMVTADSNLVIHVNLMTFDKCTERFAEYPVVKVENIHNEVWHKGFASKAAVRRLINLMKRKYDKSDDIEESVSESYT